jgi:AcrR family transcriptional regulator
MSPRVEPGERREEILEAAMRCFARTGFHRTSMNDIVAESGLSKGTLYWHFGSKRDLFLALVDKIMGEMMVSYQGALEGAASASEYLHRLSVLTGELLIKERNFAALVMSLALETWQDEVIKQHYLEMASDFIDVIEALLEEGVASGEFRAVNTREVAHGLAALFDGVFFHDFAGVGGDAAERIEIVTDLMIEGLRSKE